ncbi:hypothetical protein BGZ65_002357 [Modicella reniformis]|uniref:Uncharacterized protein n=1 Tax=Modicella reniformis TaxID=1440133 RepID=A0A9P6MI91_9FUNG|nr:hypothetical protein BGZ65_002357 [Modicella reniformis]
MSDFIAQEDHWFTTVKSLADKTPEKFFQAFGIADKNSGHRRYGNLIERFPTDADYRGLKSFFQRWKINEAATHWTDQRARGAAIRTAGSLIDASEPFAKDSLRRISDMLQAHRDQSRPLRLEDLEVPPPPNAEPPPPHAEPPPPHTEQSRPLRLEDLGQPPPPDTSRTHDDVFGEPLLIGQDEKEVLLSHIESIGHECEPREDEGCLACLFKTYQRLCVAALNQNELRITDVADVVALLGVLAPFRQTERMKSVFQDKTLGDLRKSDQEWPDVGFDENLVTTAVRHCLRGQRERVGLVLRPLEDDHRCIKLLLETRLEYLPLEEAKDLSEMDFTVKHVGPVLEAFIDSRRVSTRLHDCKSGQNAKEKSVWKNNWDFFRTVRYGKAFLQTGHRMAPLFQIIYTKGTYMRLKEAKRGMLVLEEVGPFTIPTTVEMITMFMTNIQTLMVAQADIERISTGPLNQLKRSWGYKDLDKNKRLLVQGPKGHLRIA